MLLNIKERGHCCARQVGRQDTAAAAALVAAKHKCIKERGHCCAREVGRQDAAAAAALVAAKQHCIKERRHCYARQVGRTLLLLLWLLLNISV